MCPNVSKIESLLVYLFEMKLVWRVSSATTVKTQWDTWWAGTTMQATSRCSLSSLFKVFLEVWWSHVCQRLSCQVFDIKLCFKGASNRNKVKYVAACHPKSAECVRGFWRLVWDTNVPCIVMLEDYDNNGKVVNWHKHFSCYLFRANGITSFLMFIFQWTQWDLYLLF